MDLDPRLHFVVATAIIVKPRSRAEHATGRGRQGVEFLIAKRAAREKVHPNRWTVPGGKLVFHEYSALPTTFEPPQWYNVVHWVLRKEVKEEVGLEIDKPEYLCDVVFVRPDGYPVVTLSYFARYKSGEVKLCKDLTDHAWVTLEEAKKYDLIDGIWDELAAVEKITAA